MNRTYILTDSKRRQIKVKCLLNLSYEFKYPMTVNIIKYYDLLFYTCAGCQSFISILRVQITHSSEARVEHLLLHV